MVYSQRRSSPLPPGYRCVENNLDVTRRRPGRENTYCDPNFDRYRTHTPHNTHTKHGSWFATARMRKKSEKCPKTTPRAHQRHAHRARLEHRSPATTRDRFELTPPTQTTIQSPFFAPHGSMRHVTGLQKAPAHCPATDGAEVVRASRRKSASARWPASGPDARVDPEFFARSTQGVVGDQPGVPGRAGECRGGR